MEATSSPRACHANNIGLVPSWGARALIDGVNQAVSPATSQRTHDTLQLDITWCTSLDLSEVSLGVEGGAALASALQAAEHTLHNLAHVNLTWTAIGSSSRAILETLQSKPTLRSLDLSGNWLGDEHADQVKAFIQSARSLQALHLRWNGFTEVAARSLAQAFRTSKSLQELDLGGNWLASAGLTVICKALRGHPSMRSIRADYNGISESGVKGLSEALVGNSVVTSLDLAGNEIDDNAALHLARYLMSAPSLRRINLRLNERITDVGANAIAGALASPRVHLTHVDVGGNRISDTGARALAQAAKQNRGLLVMKLGDNSPERRSGWAYGRINASVTRPLQHMLTQRKVHLARNPQEHWRWLSWLTSMWHGLGRSNDAEGRQIGPQSTPSSVPALQDYWARVYPLARPHMLERGLEWNISQDATLLYKWGPTELVGRTCEQQPWQVCRLDAFFDHGHYPPKIRRGTLFAPFRMPPGTCMRSLFSWDQAYRRKDWEAAYPFSTGTSDNTWIEVAHTRDQSGGAWMYLAKGSGIFWNCGRSLRARNKIAAAIRVTEQFMAKKWIPREKVKGSAAETLANAIATNDASACDGDHCKTFMKMFAVKRVNRNDNCYGMCDLDQAPLSVWMQRAADGAELAKWQWDHMSASSVFDHVVYRWAKRLKYDSVQLTMQPQVWCGMTWTTEILDLRVRRHRPFDLLPHLALRDPFAPLSDPGRPCIVRTDNTSRRTFHLCIYCEGSLMERTARCLADASAGKEMRHFTVYSQYPRHRFDACTRVH